MSRSSFLRTPRGGSSQSPPTQVRHHHTVPGCFVIIPPFADVFCYESEISDYKELMFNKDHRNWVGSDSEGNPVVISVYTDPDNMTTQVILRDVRETKSEKFDNTEDCGEVSSVLHLAKIVSPHLDIDNLKEIECEDIKVKKRAKSKCEKYFFLQFIRNGSQLTMKTTMNFFLERITQSECYTSDLNSLQRAKSLAISGIVRNLNNFFSRIWDIPPHTMTVSVSSNEIIKISA